MLSRLETISLHLPCVEVTLDGVQLMKRVPALEVLEWVTVRKHYAADSVEAGEQRKLFWYFLVMKPFVTWTPLKVKDGTTFGQPVSPFSLVMKRAKRGAKFVETGYNVPSLSPVSRSVLWFVPLHPSMHPPESPSAWFPYWWVLQVGCLYNLQSFQKSRRPPILIDCNKRIPDCP